MLIDLWQIVIEYLSVSEQYDIITNLQSEFGDKLFIYDMSDNSDIFVVKLTDDILHEPCFRRLRKLYVGSNPKITSLNHLTSLECLNINNSEIDDNGIMNNVNIKKLNICHTSNITSLNHLTLLEELDAAYARGIDNNSIINCTRLKRLNITGNSRITLVNNFVELTELNISWCKNIYNSGIIGCTHLRKLDIHGNQNITSLNHLVELVELNISFSTSGITNDSIRDLVGLRKLYASFNKYITSVNHLINLEYLSIRGRGGIDYSGMCNLAKLRKLCIDTLTNMTIWNNINKLRDIALICNPHIIQMDIPANAL